MSLVYSLNLMRQDLTQAVNYCQLQGLTVFQRRRDNFKLRCFFFLNVAFNRAS